jgi:uncharacterized membrane protein
MDLDAARLRADDEGEMDDRSVAGVVGILWALSGIAMFFTVFPLGFVLIVVCLALAALVLRSPFNRLVSSISIGLAVLPLGFFALFTGAAVRAHEAGLVALGLALSALTLALTCASVVLLYRNIRAAR